MVYDKVKIYYNYTAKFKERVVEVTTMQKGNLRTKLNRLFNKKSEDNFVDSIIKDNSINGKI